MFVTTQDDEYQDVYSWALIASAQDIAKWRRLAAEAVARLGGDREAQVLASLGVSELLSNIIKHVPDKACRLAVRAMDAWVYVHVFDTSRQVPAMTRPSWDAESGRGLWLLNSMVPTWGYECRADGKAVWFRVPLVRKVEVAA
ncbi:ATP-binding protein [Streptomyces sp. JJ38]|uniref:ATP-binding protein n=1 Tax=Streptomyces sp. JJ38 TaxID=2738128 RepID=UPI001C55F448|nr:ATP-binding protein [Streptomyces sp. JJ38]MBW1599434.1 ATP-binding protein [Streptomyces sp. JJ38]